MSEEIEDLPIGEKKPNIISAVEALDDPNFKNAVMQTLGFVPKVNEEGNIIWEIKEEAKKYEDWLRAYATILNSISSRRQMATSWLEEDIEPLSEIETECHTEIILELLDAAKPKKYDTLEMLALEEYAKLQQKQGMTLAKDGIIVKSLVGYPFHIEKQEMIETEEKEKKPSLLDRLLGRG